MSIIEALRNYIAAYAGLESSAPVWVGYLGSEPTEYAVIPLAGAKIVEQYLNGGSLREFPFAFQTIESTADDLARLESIGFFESFADWLENQTKNGNLPNLGASRTALVIEATTWGYLFEQGQSDTGVYQINCRLEYEQIS